MTTPALFTLLYTPWYTETPQNVYSCSALSCFPIPHNTCAYTCLSHPYPDLVTVNAGGSLIYTRLGGGVYTRVGENGTRGILVYRSETAIGEVFLTCTRASYRTAGELSLRFML